MPNFSDRTPGQTRITRAFGCFPLSRLLCGLPTLTCFSHFSSNDDSELLLGHLAITKCFLFSLRLGSPCANIIHFWSNCHCLVDCLEQKNLFNYSVGGNHTAYRRLRYAFISKPSHQSMPSPLKLFFQSEENREVCANNDALSLAFLMVRFRLCQPLICHAPCCRND